MDVTVISLRLPSIASLNDHHLAIHTPISHVLPSCILPPILPILSCGLSYPFIYPIPPLLPLNVEVDEPAWRSSRANVSGVEG